MPTVTFMPSGKSVIVPPGARLDAACREAGFPLPTPCGGKGLCGKCRVKLLGGDIPADDRGQACLPPQLLRAGWRAACVARVEGDLLLADPEPEKDTVVLTDFMTRGPRGESGLWTADVAAPLPSTADQRDDLTRLRETLAAAGVDAEVALAPHLLATLPEQLRRGDFSCRVHGLGERALAVRSAAEEPRPLGLAVDLGSTTLAAALCDLDDGAVLAVASRANPQAQHGDDVISRVDYAGKGESELAELRLLAVRAVEELAEAAMAEAGLDQPPLLLVIAGNTVMTHLLAGVPPRALAVSPFVPAFLHSLDVWASRFGWRNRQPPLLLTLPGISAYVGGDIVAGLLAHDVHRREGNVLYLDIGTNGEIALAVGGVVYACATAAGPAFEGARIGQGMRAAPGAISRVALSESGGLEIGVVDAHFPARGICGTGLLDAVAALLRGRLVDEGGRMLDADETREPGSGVHPALAALVHENADGPAVWLERPAGRGQLGVALSQRDVREFQLAKGAVAAGVKVLLNVAGIAAGDLDQVLLAGGFGNYLDPVSALAVGLLPAEVPIEKIKSVGNASLAGARLFMLSGEERREAAELARAVRYIELSGRDDFQIAFAEEMLFPEP